MSKTVEVLPDLASLIHRGLGLSLAEIKSAITKRGQCTLALAGGGTPKPLYEALATQDLPWEKIQIFWGDERYVPPDDSDSNQRMARQAWLDQVPIPAANLHPIPTDEVNPAVAAQKYEQHLQAFFGIAPGEFPALDLIFLGIGNDGHTASLFPHTEALQVCDRLITVGNKDGQPRITFTVPLINQARCVMFLVAGESKQPALEQIFAPEAEASDYPARFIQPTGKLLWLLDQPAGKRLKP